MPDDVRQGAAELLDRVIDFLADPDHWHQGSWSGDGGRNRCVIATFTMENRADGRHQDAIFQTALGAVADQLGVSQFGPGVRDWNDDPHTMHGDLMLTLKRARATL